MILVRTPLLLLAMLSLSLAGEPARAAEDNPVSLTVGGRTVILPLPAQGFVRCDGINEGWDRAMTATLPATNRLLASFGTKENQQAIREGKSIDFSRNFSIQTMRAEENREIGTRNFSQVRTSIRKEIDGMKANLEAELKKLAEEGSRKLSKELGVDAALEFSQVAVLGYFDESETSLGFTLAMNVGTSAAGISEKTRSVVAARILPVNGRLVMLYSASNYAGESDRQEVERSVTAWGDAVIAANPKVEGSGGGTPLAALVGAALGIAVALYLIFKRRNAA